MALAARSSSMPESPGILRSVSTRSTPPPCSRSSAACPSEATTTRYPSRASVRSRLSRSPGSSSATRMFAGSAMRSLERQPDREARAAARPARPPDLAAVLLGDLPRDRQPEPRPLRLGREERLAHTSAHVVGNAATAVGPAQLHGVAVPPTGERELAAARQGLQAVLHEIEDGLTQQAAIDLHQRHVGVGLHTDGEPLARRHRPDEVREL